MTYLQLAFQGSTIPKLPTALTREMDKYSQTAGKNQTVLGILRGDKAAIKEGKSQLSRSTTDAVTKIEIAKAFGTVDDPGVAPDLLRIPRLDQASALKRVAQSLANHQDPNIPKTILYSIWVDPPAEHHVRSTADRVMASRPEWAKAYLEKIDLAHIKARDILPDVVQLLLQHKDPEINRKVTRHLPHLAPKGTLENQKEIERVKRILFPAKEMPATANLFTQRCAACHKLFEEGGVIAPDLTGYERDNLDFWLPGIIDPNLEIREGYANYVVTTTDGCDVLMGMVSKQNPKSVTLRDPASQTTTIPRSKIQKLEAIPAC